MINPGARPSRLALGRHATGEAVVDTSAPTSQAFLAALEAERARVEPFDFEVLRARAARLDERPTAAPAPATPWWRRVWFAVPVLAVAAAAVVALRVPTERPTHVLKGSEGDLGFYVLRDGQVYPGDTDAVFRAGDRLQFTYRTPHSRLVLLSVDGDGHFTLFYPEAGEAGVPVTPGDRHVLDGSLILDDAPGPEVFLGFFGDDWTVSRARDAALRAWEAGGTDALVRLADDPTVSALALERE